MSNYQYYPGFREKMQPKLDALAERSGIASLLIMRSAPTTMITEVSAGPRKESYKPGDAGPKSVQEGAHKLYCEQVVNTREPLEVPDAAADPEWKGNADLVEFGLGTYLGFPIEGPDGEILGTVCALHDKPFNFDEGDPSLREGLARLRDEIEADLREHAGEIAHVG
jgi:GAF domain-containing protein